MERAINVANLETIKFDVMGRSAEDTDFHGIRTLLSSQLLPHTDVDVGNFTDLIIEQNYVGSVIVEDCDSMPGDDDDDDDMEEIILLGVTTAVCLQERERFSCVKQLRELLRSLSEKHGGNSKVIEDLLAEDPCKLGLLVNERFVNIPQTIAPPIFNSLRKELRSAVNKKMAFSFSHYVLIAKINKVKIDNEIVDEWVNQEEEFLDDKAVCKFEFPLEQGDDSSIEEQLRNTEVVPFRRVLVFTSEAFEHLVDSMRTGE
ncbi:protein BCCIP homolog [Neocloeon triangulifer]|uniref:protein BCCIP homolog n=1 Tax=Neocloeon triangulifer TaxID=2078957 RepID=UPI00286F4941|nr:protein BCCIP homolog [Neocloeon triangulifer]XP_059474316.1 protein BCCIP homolog [Neocloeon triangulifer]